MSRAPFDLLNDGPIWFHFESYSRKVIRDNRGNSK
jgi:hypothetical protein